MKTYILACITAFVCILAPDIFTTFFVATEETPYRWYSHYESLVFLAIITASIVAARSLPLKLCLMSLILFFQLTQLVHFSYYGTFYSQYSIGYMFSEMGDFIAGTQALLVLIWPSLTVCLLSAALIFAVLIYHHKTAKQPLTNIPAYMLCILMMFPLIKSLYHYNDYKPSAKQLAIRCGLYSWSSYFSMGYKTKDTKEYAPYTLSSQQPMVDNLVLIIGESANYQRMSLFGADRDTTPYLKSLVHSEQFHHQLAFSSSVATQYSMGYFLNGVYEPDNAIQMGSKGANLFKIAEQNGYEMHFLSNHTIGAQSQIYRYGQFHTWIDKSMDASQQWQYDKGLVDAYLKERGAKRTKQFVVLHTYNMHTPYTDNYPEDFQVFPPEGDDASGLLKGNYDNSLKYFDHTIEYWVDRLTKELDGTTLIVYVPDHGEKFQGDAQVSHAQHHKGSNGDEHKHAHNHGDGGWHGHGFLDIDVATVPIFAISVNGANHALDAFKSQLGCISSHYKIHHALASVLGTDIINPNQQEDTFYISGLSYYGAAGWIEGHFPEHEFLCNIRQQQMRTTSAY
jgi:glucan phosphoethanolaminetransferase (alkaline phosphatase superfamily)